MTHANLSDFSAVLLELYRCAHEQPLDEFQESALELVRPLVPFDKSMWGTATMRPTGVDIHTVHLHRTSQEMLDAYEQVKHEDTAAAAAATGSGTTVSVHSPIVNGGTELGEFTRRFMHQNVFISVDVNPETNFVHWISLFRSDIDAHCKEDERQRLALLQPHLKQALSMNRRKHLELLAPTIGELRQGRAVADLRGLIYDADPQFKELLRDEWPHSDGTTLPATLLESFSRGEEHVSGRWVIVRGHVAHRLLFLQARQRCRADSLTARERSIAKLIAKGETHKEIARRLARAPATVRNQIQTIYTKLDVGNIAGLIDAMRPID